VRDAPATIRLPVGSDQAGERLDVVVSQGLELSRTRVQRLLEQGRVEVHGEGAPSPERLRKSEPVHEGWVVEVTVPAPESVSLRAEDLPIDIVYQDADLAVVNKAAGMVVHPAPGHREGTLVNALMYHVRDLSGVGGRLRPGIVHRLDRDTSGLLVVAKSDRAHQGLAEALKRREVKRLYVAAAWGHLDASPMTIDQPLARDPRSRRRMAVVEGGRRSVTRVRVRERWRAAELLDVALETGRTHQIRVHLAHLGHPVVGDDLYGAGWERGMGGDAHAWARELARRVKRQFLHAAELAFEHPVTGESMRFRAPLPPDLEAAARWAFETSSGAAP
jgi:23S rRNA pseudouridine1911/1915/1917 synthase